MELVIHPKIEILQNRNGHLQERLVLLLSEKVDLMKTVLPGIRAKRLQLFGALELESLDLQIRIRQLRFLLSEIRKALAAGRQPDIEAIFACSEEEILLWRENFKREADLLKEAESRMKSLMSHTDSEEMKRIYRTLVKDLHPDLHPDQGDQGRLLWQQVQDAYASGDMLGLKTLRLLVSEGKSVHEIPLVETLNTENRRISQQVCTLVEEIRKIRTGADFHLAEKLADALWVKEQKLVLKRGIRQLKSKVLHLEEHYELLLGGEDRR